jgi:transposase
MTQLPGHLAHLSPRQREEIVRRVEGGEESMRAIASAMGLNESTVSRTYKRWCESGDVVEHLAGGHTSAYDDDDLYQLECLIDAHRSASADTLHALMPSSAPHVTAHTIAAYRRALGYTRRRPAVWQIDTERTAERRAAWVREHRAADHTQWVYMDESTLCLRDTGDYVWVRQGEPTPLHEIEQLRCHVNVWGAVWSQSAVFCFYTGHLDSATYIEVLKTQLLPHRRQIRRHTLVHDGATSHRAKATKEWCVQEDLDLLLLPPHSPQFNAIERVWGWLKRKVRQAEPRDHAALAVAMQKAWEALPQNDVVAFIKEAHNNLIAHS